MAGSLNKVMIIGNVGRDPEMRYTQNGTPVTSFSVAANRRWTTPEGDQREETEWVNVVAWRQLAETANRFVAKGSKVYIEGRLQTRSWEGQDGQKRYRTEVVAQTLLLLDSRPKTPGTGDEAYPPEEIEPEEIPF
ncbi:MAG: single-stranded DNA-binding protein [Chloroflexi bacterium]|nr:single-stranded DNA-binding protein [Chloroflexota bacterium]